MTLGFDVSTTCAGWAFSQSGSIKDAGFIDIKDFPTSKEKAFHVISTLEKHKYFNQIQSINLEAALSGFAGGFTSQQVIIKLSRFNAIFEYIVSEKWNIPIQLVNVNTARKKLFGKCREKGMKPKDYVRSKLELMYDIHKFDVIKKSKKKNTPDKPDERNSDIYDAVVLSLY